mgnify:CR=1 FL=1
MMPAAPAEVRGLPRIRYRGLHLPLHPHLLSEARAEALQTGTWQAAFTEAAFALAQSDDTALIWGLGAGHVTAILAGKLGLPRVYVADPAPESRRHLTALAWLNGLPRLKLVSFDDAQALAPTLLFADLASAPRPNLAAWPNLRAAAIEMGPEPGAADLAALRTSAETTGLRQDQALTAGSCMVYVRPRDRMGD